MIIQNILTMLKKKYSYNILSSFRPKDKIKSNKLSNP